MTNINLCGCGCKGEVNVFRGKPNAFIVGHNTRMYKGEKAPGWKGGRHVDAEGYVWLRKPDHPDALRGYVSEHRFVLEQYLERYLERGETRDFDEIPHHMDGNKQNNTIENLELCLHGMHTSFHQKIVWNNRKGTYGSEESKEQG